MKAVDLIPQDSRRRSFGGGTGGGLSYVLIGVLAIAVLFVTIDVLTSNTISSRKAKIAQLSQQATNAQNLANSLQSYTTFAALAQTRTSTVKEIAAARFDWHSTFLDLSRVIPADTVLSSIDATVAAGAGSSTSTGGTSDLRGDISVPALQLAGCADHPNDVPGLMSDLRVIPGVTRVSFEDEQAVQSNGASSTAGSSGPVCGAGKGTFDLVVFFTALASAGPQGVVSTSTTATTGTTP
jgi:Tfp pilus assembly protein PilN